MDFGVGWLRVSDLVLRNVGPVKVDNWKKRFRTQTIATK